MPNWAYNNVKISGNERDLQKIITQLETNDNKFDFNKVIPMPEELNIEGGPECNMMVYYCKHSDIELSMSDLTSIFKYENFESVDEAIDKHTAAPWLDDTEEHKAKTMELGKKAYENYMTYGYTSWYNWCVNRWGTKWNAIESNIHIAENGSIVYNFDTAWNEPFPVFLELSKQNPNVLIEAYTTYESGDEPTGYAFRNGQVIQHYIMTVLEYILNSGESVITLDESNEDFVVDEKWSSRKDLDDLADVVNNWPY